MEKKNVSSLSFKDKKLMKNRAYKEWLDEMNRHFEENKEIYNEVLLEAVFFGQGGYYLDSEGNVEKIKQSDSHDK